MVVEISGVQELPVMVFQRTFARIATVLCATLAMLAPGVVGAAAPYLENSAMTIPKPGGGVPERVVAEMGRLLDDSTRQLNRHLAKSIEELRGNPDKASAQWRTARAASLRAEIELTRLRLLGRAGPLVTAATREAVKAGIVRAKSQLSDLGVGPAARAAGAEFMFHSLDERNVEVIARDTLARLNGAYGDHAARAQFVFRSLAGIRPGVLAEPAVNTAIARGLITGDPREADRALRDLFRDPHAPVIESYRRLGGRQIHVGGWTGSVRQYTEMVVRTRTREATVEAQHERLGAAGIDLVQIIGNVTANYCTRFIGLVVSISGNTAGYPALADLPEGGPPFHPNCSKDTAAYHEDLVDADRLQLATRAGERYERDRAADRLRDPIAA